MTAERRSFYTTWAILWAVFGTLLSAALSSRPDGIARFFDLESWFAMFPIAWTGALLVTRHRERLHAFWSSRQVRERIRDLGFIALWTFQAYSLWWQGGAVHRTGAYLMGSLACMALILVIRAEVKAWRARSFHSP